MKVRCTECKVESDDSQWKETDFFCEECQDDHTGYECPTPGCRGFEGPGLLGGWRRVR